VRGVVTASLASRCHARIRHRVNPYSSPAVPLTCTVVRRVSERRVSMEYRKGLETDDF
jgi:hypothetical protein